MNYIDMCTNRENTKHQKILNSKHTGNSLEQVECKPAKSTMWFPTVETYIQFTNMQSMHLPVKLYAKQFL